jgi:indolepyruvate ferredoxin oxidoreductase alpha subunit
VEIDERCNQLHICVSEFACPSYQLQSDGSVWVQEDLCIGDGSCKQTCPSEAIVSRPRDTASQEKA